MDESLRASPLETVQFISIFSYLNTLSDFLIIENYLSEDDQTKQIPIVNGLYQYLEYNRDNQAMKVKLVRTLLKGSDLFGEEENENVDIVFINVMFDYIISSLVFDKYGNIYGFIADVVRKVNNFQIDSLCKEMKSTLKNITYENEYGNRSTLTDTAAERIFSDILLPLFPKPKRNLNLFSLDYIYAQAGSIFLRPGKINTTYYTDTKSYNVPILDEEHLFDEYLTTGHILEYLLTKDTMKNLTVKAFALPAICYYVSKNKLLLHENITNIITDPTSWNEAYEYLFANLDETLQGIDNQLEMDYTYQIQKAFSNFFSTNVIDKFKSDARCSTNDCLNPNLQYNYITEWLQSEINAICETYKKYDLNAVRKSFGNSMTLLVNSTKLRIRLIVPDNEKKDNFLESQKLSFDLLEFYFPENQTKHRYALIRENYTVTLIKESSNQQVFQQTLGYSSLSELLNYKKYKTLKHDNESIDVFFKNMTEYKTNQLQSYLNYTLGHSDLTVNWWKEFGFSLIPYYQYFRNVTKESYYENSKIHHEVNIIHLLDQFVDKSSQLTQTDTQYFLASIGTTIGSVSLRSLSVEIVAEILSQVQHRNLMKPIKTSMTNTLEKICFHKKEPGFDITNLTEEVMKFLQSIIDALKGTINNRIFSIKNILNNIENLKFFTYMSTRHLFVKTRSTSGDTGFGYKYINLTQNITAQLRTSCELKQKILVLFYGITKADEKIYIELSNKNSAREDNYLFEINNNQLRKYYNRHSYFEIPIAPDIDVKCNTEGYITGERRDMDCPKQKRLQEKNHQEDEAVKLALNYTHPSKDEIHTKIRKYVFPDKGGLESKFVEDWLNYKNLDDWSKNFTIDNHRLLFKLRYEMSLDNPNLSDYFGKFRIDAIYNKREIYTIEKGTTIENIIQDYNDQTARYSVTFEDYYAIRNFATTGYTRITADTNEAKYMKSALYKLAIRQSDDPENQFHLRLFKVESKPIDFINRTLAKVGKIFTLTKFTLTSTSELEAIKFAAVAAPGFHNIWYEMKFSESYLRGKIGKYDKDDELKVILLPGSDFVITSVKETQIKNLGYCLNVTLIYRPIEKYEWYKKAMSEMARIKF